MWSAELGAILFLSPYNTAVQYGLLIVGLIIGLFLNKFVKHSCSYYQTWCLAACMQSIHLDFKIPLDVLIISVIPILIIKWNINKNVEKLWTLAFIINYFFAQDVVPSKHEWLPPVLAAGAVATNQHPIHVIVLIIVRQWLPKSVHTFYGIILCCHPKNVYVPYLANDVKILLLVGLGLFLANYYIFVFEIGFVILLLLFLIKNI
jgi:hypothetical protein